MANVLMALLIHKALNASIWMPALRAED